MPKPPLILYIAGYGRSGSTILSRVAGQAPGCFSAGELRYLWERGLGNNERCGCGNSFSQCAFWRRIIADIKVVCPQFTLGDIYALFKRVDPNETIPFALFKKRQLAPDIRRYATVIEAAYKAISQRSGCNVIIDSSKACSHAAILARFTDMDVKVIHLVRDSRAVAYSWIRKRVRPEIHWKTDYMPRFSPARTALVWNLRNSIVEKLFKNSNAYYRMRYEDFIAEPCRELDRAFGSLGLDEQVKRISIDGDHQVNLGVDHSVSGNPARFKQGPVKLIVDEEWKSHLKGPDRQIVSVLTWPLRRKYGYR